MNPIFPEKSGVTLLFEHSPSQAGEKIILRVLVARKKINLPCHKI